MTDQTQAPRAVTGEELAAIEAKITRLLPIETRDTPDYAEVAFNGEASAQAMTMEPETFQALNDLPAVFALARLALLDRLEQGAGGDLPSEREDGVVVADAKDIPTEWLVRAQTYLLREAYRNKWATAQQVADNLSMIEMFSFALGGESSVCSERGSVYDRLLTFLHDRDCALRGDELTDPNEIDEAVIEIMKIVAPVPDAPQAGVVSLKTFADDVTDVQSRFVIVHQLRASADIQDSATKRETGWATTSDRAELMRKAADTIEALALPVAPGGSGDE